MTEEEVKFVEEMEDVIEGEARHFYTEEMKKACALIRNLDSALQTRIRENKVFYAELVKLRRATIKYR